MAQYYLPLKPINEKIGAEFLYLVIAKYKMKEFKKGDKHTKKDIEIEKKMLNENIETIKSLDTLYFNCFNSPHIAESIFKSSFFPSYIDNMENYIIYKIEPISCKKTNESYCKKYHISEFKVLNKMTIKEEVIEQIYNDGLLKEFYCLYFKDRGWNNDSKIKLYEFMEYINNKYPLFKIELFNFLMDDTTYTRDERFSNINQCAMENIRYAVNKGYVKYFYYSNYFHTNAIKTMKVLLKYNLFDIAFEFIKQIGDEDKKNIEVNNDIEFILRNKSDNDIIKKIIDYLDIKLKGVILTVIKIKYGDYEDTEEILETTRFDNISQAKTHIIKKYDVPFDLLQNDIDYISYRQQGYTEYKFNIT